jgi:uncharacterized membrane protein YcaP (DUF421 family)
MLLLIDLPAINWLEMFSFSVNPLEIFIRGTLIYLLCFVVMRFTRRGISGVSIADLLIIVMIADAAQNGMSADYKSVTDGIILILTLIFWDYVLNLLQDKVPFIRNLFYPKPVELIKNGKLLRRNMDKNFITYEELMSQIRQQGIEKVSEVKASFMEGDGSISIIPLEKDKAKSKDLALSTPEARASQRRLTSRKSLFCLN